MPFLSPCPFNKTLPGERCPGLGEHLGPVQHEHAEGAGVPALGRPGEPVGVLQVHRLQPLRGGAGVQGSQVHTGRYLPPLSPSPNLTVGDLEVVSYPHAPTAVCFCRAAV